MGFIIKPFPKEDIDQAKDIYNYYVDTSTATFSMEHFTHEEMEKTLFNTNKRFPSYGYYEDGQLIGYGIISQFNTRQAFDGTSEIAVYFHKDYTNKGYGKIALGHMIEKSKELEFDALLAKICAENTESIKLFKSFGFFECGNLRKVGRKFGRILDVVIYERVLIDEA